MAIRVRNIGAQDAVQIAELLEEIGWFEFFKKESIAAASERVKSHIEQLHADDSHSAFVAETLDGEIVGYVSAHWLPYLFLQGLEGYVSEVFVRESARGQGIGRELLQTIETEAKARGCVRLSLINLRNRESYLRQFYIKAGWEERTEAANFIYRIRY
ncbi:MAG TPA: GNAT family N-acetyltransferase [Candidatus Binatia bacterium]|jgi:GNAT superfamily N-acetyltransferase